VINRTLKLAAFACCSLVLASFGLFALDQLAGASKHQQTELASGTPATPPPVTAHHGRDQPRRFIDGAARTLTSPFSSIVQSGSQWVQHMVPTIFALLVYGLGLGFLARFSRGLS
jgi:hypothetical protein